MEYCLALKRKTISDTHSKTDGNEAEWKNPDIKGQMLYDSTYMRHLELSNSHREGKCWFPAAGVDGGWGAGV